MSLRQCCASVLVSCSTSAFGWRGFADVGTFSPEEKAGSLLKKRVPPVPTRAHFSTNHFKAGAGGPISRLFHVITIDQ